MSSVRSRLPPPPTTTNHIRGGCYDTAGRLLVDYHSFCTENGFPFTHDLSLKPYDDTTLFCVAGMQQHTSKFRDKSVVGVTLGNVQGCLRLDDLSEVGDGTHYLYFHMLGMFSFRHLTVEQTVRLWMDFLGRIGITPDYVTVHPDRQEWGDYHTVPVRLDEGCTWTDGRGPPSYCTEFYVGEVEVGNIVNPYGDCIDVGFGLERLSLVLGGEVPTRNMVLRETTLRIIEDDYLPGNKKQGYVLRKILRTLVKEGVEIDHPFWHTERERQRQTLDKYERLRRKHGDQPPEWWWDTHGIDVSLL